MVEVAHSIDLNLPEKLRDREYRQKFFLAESSAQIAAQLIALRKRRDLNQQQVAELIGTQQPAISRIEKADYQSWSFSILRKVADALDARLQVSIEPAEDILYEYDEDHLNVENTLRETEFPADSEVEALLPALVVEDKNVTNLDVMYVVPNDLTINGIAYSNVAQPVQGAYFSSAMNYQTINNQAITTLQREVAERDQKLSTLMEENRRLRDKLIARRGTTQHLLFGKHGLPDMPLFNVGGQSSWGL